MAPRPFSCFSFPLPSSRLRPALPLLLLLFALRPSVVCSSGADAADAVASPHGGALLPQGRPPSAPLPQHLQTPSSHSGVGSGGDRNHSPRDATDDRDGGDVPMKGGGRDDWRGDGGQRRRRGHGGDDGVTSMVPRNSCKDLRSKRYISDGFCTSTRPLTEAVCAEKCCSPAPSNNRQRQRSHGRPHKYRPQHSLPASPISLHRSSSNHHLQPWYADYVKVWARGKNEMNSVTAGVGGTEEDGEDEGDEDGGEDEEDEDGGAVEWRCVEDAVRRRRVRLLCRDGTRRTYHVRLIKSCKCVQRRRQRRRRRGRRKGRRRLGRMGGWVSRRASRRMEEE